MEKEIVEVEVLDETLDEVKKPSSSVRAVDPDAKKKTYISISLFLNRFALMVFFLGFVFGMTFSILHSQDPKTVFLILLIIGWSVASLGAIGYPLGFLFRHLALKEEDA